MRVPGSRNSKVKDGYVRFERLVGEDDKGNIVSYTLDELAKILEVDPPEFRPSKEGKRRAEFRGHVALWQQRYIAFDQLRRIRGGAFKDGGRHNACFLLALILWRTGLNKPDVERDVLALARQCQPAIPETEARMQIASALRKRMKFRESTMCAWLNLTEEERAQIPRWSQAAQIPLKPCTQDERRQAVASVIGSLRFRPSLRHMQRELRGQGIPACPETIRRIYASLPPANAHNVTSSENRSK
jgi:hypothetical protein